MDIPHCDFDITVPHQLTDHHNVDVVNDHPTSVGMSQVMPSALINTSQLTIVSPSIPELIIVWCLFIAGKLVYPIEHIAPNVPRHCT